MWNSRQSRNATQRRSSGHPARPQVRSRPSTQCTQARDGAASPWLGTLAVGLGVSRRPAHQADLSLSLNTCVLLSPLSVGPVCGRAASRQVPGASRPPHNTEEPACRAAIPRLPHADLLELGVFRRPAENIDLSAHLDAHASRTVAPVAERAAGKRVIVTASRCHSSIATRRPDGPRRLSTPQTTRRCPWRSRKRMCRQTM